MSGSPPRVREKLRDAKRKLFDTGITPACAGKTLKALASCSEIRDHPRVCGKNHHYFLDCSHRVGSPPRVREKPMIRTAIVYLLWDHPRVCGKNDLRRQGIKTQSGSPPRVREKPTVVYAEDSSSRDHPRVCGKNSKLRLILKALMGSPPRVREKH